MPIRCFWVLRPRRASSWVPAAATVSRPVRPVRRTAIATTAAVRPRAAAVLTLVCVATGVPPLIAAALREPAVAPPPVIASAPTPGLLFPLAGAPLVFSDGGGGGLSPGGGETGGGGPGGGPGGGSGDGPGGGGGTPVPEPAGLGLLGVAVAALALLRRRRSG
ncbi:PEP-CTERM sorting domain-containing protein [Elioraea tepida]|uniref:PEP-CTERM sorting domain-containing protein n=1 Tax=Elioraea tepida TaxID=2843330 RepID=UPI0038B3FBC2